MIFDEVPTFDWTEFTYYHPDGLQMQYCAETDTLEISNCGCFVLPRDAFLRLIKLGLTYYELHSDEEIAAYNEDKLERHLAGRGPRPKSELPTRSRAGYVYLLHGNGFYKIGRAAVMSARMDQLHVHLPFPVKLLRAIETEDSPALEAYWHKQFASKRTNGEWFDLNPEDVNTFLTFLNQ